MLVLVCGAIENTNDEILFEKIQIIVERKAALIKNAIACASMSWLNRENT
jgi:hypothetical protein